MVRHADWTASLLASPLLGRHSADDVGIARDDHCWCHDCPDRLGRQVFGALRELDPSHGEIKSMRTATGFRRRGVGEAVLQHILEEARRRGYTRLSLETGSMPYFAPARGLYLRFGFEVCEPFAQYKLDPNSVFMTRVIEAEQA